MHDRYLDQVRLLVQVLPHIAKEQVFALKGGTAINLFYRDPRITWEEWRQKPDVFASDGDEEDET